MIPTHAAQYPELLARKKIDVAIGVLVGVRRCTEEAAFRELAAVARQTGCRLGDTADALIACACTDCAHHQSAAHQRWGELFPRE